MTEEEQQAAALLAKETERLRAEKQAKRQAQETERLKAQQQKEILLKATVVIIHSPMIKAIFSI